MLGAFCNGFRRTSYLRLLGRTVDELWHVQGRRLLQRVQAHVRFFPDLIVQCAQLSNGEHDEIGARPTVNVGSLAMRECLRTTTMCGPTVHATTTVGAS